MTQRSPIPLFVAVSNGYGQRANFDIQARACIIIGECHSGAVAFPPLERSDRSADRNASLIVTIKCHILKAAQRRFALVPAVIRRPAFAAEAARVVKAGSRQALRLGLGSPGIPVACLRRQAVFLTSFFDNDRVAAGHHVPIKDRLCLHTDKGGRAILGIQYGLQLCVGGCNRVGTPTKDGGYARLQLANVVNPFGV